MGYLQDFDHGLDGADRRKKITKQARECVKRIELHSALSQKISVITRVIISTRRKAIRDIINLLCPECARGDKATRPMSGGWRHDQDYCQAEEIWEMISNENM